MTRFALTGARIFDGERVRDGDALIIAGDRIEAIVRENALAPAIERHELAGGLLAPGFIDVQVNGGGGVLFNNEPSLETVRQIAIAHRRFGTTGLLPTVVTDDPDIMHAAGDAIAAARHEHVPGILGIHFEGPFIDDRRRGAHEESFIRPITAEDIDYFRGLDCGTVMVTVAPSTVEPDIIAALVTSGIIISLGHAEATAQQALAALRAGARGFTHLYNAMSQLSVRAAGMVGVALTDRNSYCSIIADGHHVDPVALQLAIAAKPKGRLFLITDAMPTAAGGPQSFLLQGREIRLRNGRLQLSNDTLAGSNLTMDEAVRYCCTALEIEREEALRMASLYPAAFLGLDDRLGRLAPGYQADLVHLSDDLRVFATWIGGQDEAESRS